jgi:hypothetical protein
LHDDGQIAHRVVIARARARGLRQAGDPHPS